MVKIEGDTLHVERLKSFKANRVISEVCSIVHYMSIHLFQDLENPIWKESMKLDLEKSAKLWFDQYNEEEKIKILKLEYPGPHVTVEEEWNNLMGTLRNKFREDRLKILL